MSDDLMDTRPGGESTQYESVQTVTQPPAKDEGQFGDADATDSTTQAQDERDARGEKTAENVRYGQKLSEEGMGGTTTDSSGTANADSGYGRKDEMQDEEAQGRGSQGYGGRADMDREVGA